MSPGLHLAIFLASFASMQAMLAAWSWRVTGSPPMALLVALLPPVGLPYQLWQLRRRLLDNHVAGAVTYLGLLVASFAFYFAYPADEVPWTVILTMAIFAFLGSANVVATRLRD